MSKTNLLINKRNPTVSILNKQKNMIQNTTTYRDIIKDDDSQKLYTFCSSQTKQIGLNYEQDIKNISKQRKTSFNNVKGKIYQPSKSKGKISSQINIHKDKKKQNNHNITSNNSSILLNNSNITDRRKTQKVIGRENKREQKMINISINLNKNILLQKQNENGNILNDKSNIIDKKISSDIMLAKQGEYKNEGKIMIVMNEQQLKYFTKKQAISINKLEQKIELLNRQLQQYKQKQIQWNNFKKDSQDYIKYLIKQKQQILLYYQNNKQQILKLKNDNQYYILAKDQYKNTIHQQQIQIHQLKIEIKNINQQIEILQSKILQQSKKQKNNTIHILEIQNNHLKKQLQIYQNYQINKNIKLIQLQQSKQKISQLNLSKQLLSSELKQLYIYKLKCQVYQKNLQDSTHIIAKLKKQIEQLKYGNNQNKHWNNESVDSNQFQFRLDTSPHSPSRVEVVWKRQKQDDKNIQVQQYFDHDFFQGYSKYKI